ncbi:MAG TPA: chemotaxis protein CheW [Polyangiaceae bacterium]
MPGPGARFSLLCRVKGRFCALPLSNVIEIMRPLAVEALLGAPPFVLGLSIIRGEATAVVSARRLFGDEDGPPGRFVTLRTGRRKVALAVDDVLEVRALDAELLSELPPLLREVEGTLASRLGALDAELLMVFADARAFDEQPWLDSVSTPEAVA